MQQFIADHLDAHTNVRKDLHNYSICYFGPEIVALSRGKL